VGTGTGPGVAHLDGKIQKCCWHRIFSTVFSEFR
jgi:hypothetical protein